MFKHSCIQTAALALTTLTLSLCVNLNAAAANVTQAFDRKMLLENPVELASPSVNARVIRVKLPPGFKTPEHTHDGPGPRYVSKGKVKVMESNKINTYVVGEVFWESGGLMSVENVGAGEAELIIFELAPAK